MEDLREVGEKVINAIKNRKPVDAGDLAIGIGNIIEELRGKPEGYEEKVNHLEGLFRELVYGEEYELRKTKAEQERDLLDEVLKAAQNPPIISSGMFLGGNGIPAVSGYMPNFNLPISTNSINTPPVINPCGEVPIGEPEECSMPAPEPEEEEEGEVEPDEEFKPAWWKKQV